MDHAWSHRELQTAGQHVYRICLLLRVQQALLHRQGLALMFVPALTRANAPTMHGAATARTRGSRPRCAIRSPGRLWATYGSSYGIDGHLEPRHGTWYRTARGSRLHRAVPAATAHAGCMLGVDGHLGPALQSLVALHHRLEHRSLQSGHVGRGSWTVLRPHALTVLPALRACGWTDEVPHE